MQNNIQPKYISFEIAKWLKEKGFDIPVQYGVFGKAMKFTEDFGNRHRPKSRLRNWNTDKANSYSVPEQWKVVEWLRVKHGIFIEIRYMDDVLTYGYVITTIIDNTEQDEKYGYKTPKEAYSAAFDYIKDNDLI